MEADFTAQDFGIGRLFRESWKLYRENFTSILVVMLCVYLPIEILTAFIATDSLIQEYGVRGIQLYFNILRLLDFLIGTIAMVGTAAIVEKSLQGATYTWRNALKYGFSRWPTIIRTGFLASIIVLGLTILLIVPGIIWSGYYYFWIYVVALRNIGGKTALDYSKRLVEGQWWRVCGVSLVLWVTAFVTGLIVTFPLNRISANQFFGIIPGIVADITGSFFAVATVVFFLNVDYRRKTLGVEQISSPIAESEA